MEVEVTCPYCGEPTVIVVDEGGGSSVEDCTVCCQPIEVSAKMDADGDPILRVTRSDD